jgi:hypothetical protein
MSTQESALSSKFLTDFVYSLLVLLAACGVKNDPVAPEDSKIPSFEETQPEYKLPEGTLYKNRSRS